MSGRIRRLLVRPSPGTIRGRVALSLAVTLLAGAAAVPLLGSFVAWFLSLIETPCRRLAYGSAVCRLAIRHPGLRDGAQIVPLAVALGVLVLLVLLAARWCLEPLRRMAEPLSAVGPQNLGYRVADAEPAMRDDPDLAALGAAVDAMMERVSAGYEGQRRFAANASHELRTPLSVQRTLIEVGLAEDLNSDQVQLLTRQLLATNERNERLIEGLLVLAETDQGLLSRSAQRLDEIVAEVVAAHAASAAAAGVQVSVEVSAASTSGERVLLERLVANLVQNAVKYNRPGGRVDVRAHPRPTPAPGAVVLTVSNSGEPVPGEAVAGLFEPFRRLRGERIDHAGGAGLGLTIARSIVAAHDGVITASANAADQGGLRVTVSLPLLATLSHSGAR